MKDFRFSTQQNLATTSIKFQNPEFQSHLSKLMLKKMVLFFQRLHWTESSLSYAFTKFERLEGWNIKCSFNFVGYIWPKKLSFRFLVIVKYELCLQKNVRPTSTLAPKFTFKWRFSTYMLLPTQKKLAFLHIQSSNFASVFFCTMQIKNELKKLKRSR